MRNFDGLNPYQKPVAINNPYNPPKRKRRWWKFILVIILAAVIAGVLYGSNILGKANQIFTGKQNIFTRVSRLFVSDDVPLKGEEEGQINILLLGLGGPGHDGPNLTDTMIIASINPTTSEVSLISIPRDFMVRLPNLGYNKINAAYAYAEKDREGAGGQAAIDVAEQISGLEIPYYASVDFKGFVKAVDHVGGLDITVDRTFTDSTYPNYNTGYLAPQTFTKGQEHMDGERALIFTRSRHGNNGEGSDFARSERQKKIMLALKEKLLKLNVTSVSTLNKLLGDFTENFRTNMEPHELLRLSGLGSKISGDNVFSLSLDPQANLICDAMVDLATGKLAPAPVVEPTTPEDGETDTTTPPTDTGTPTDSAPAEDTGPQIVRAYVVTPCIGKTLSDVHAFLQKSMRLASLQKEDATIEIINSTGKAGAATKWQGLSDYGITVKFSTSKTPLDRTILYDNTKSSKPKTLQYLKTQGNFVVSDLPYTQSTSDFVIILGRDSL